MMSTQTEDRPFSGDSDFNPANTANWKGVLGVFLSWIKGADEAGNYDRRNEFVIAAVETARNAGYSAGFRIDPKEPEWPVAFIELPQGQVSWHIQQHEFEWDGHTTEEKYRRVDQFVEENVRSPRIGRKAR